MSQDASVVEKHLLEEYGSVVRWNGPLGVFFSVIPDLWPNVDPILPTGKPFMGRRSQGHKPYSQELSHRFQKAG